MIQLQHLLTNMQRIIISTDMTQEQECTSSSALQDPSQTRLVWKREMQTLEALQQLDEINLTLNELLDESSTPTELLGKNPRQRELLNEYSALKDPEAQDIFLLRELIVQFTAMKELVDENPHLDSSALRELKAAIPQLQEQMDELDWEDSTLKEQTATNNVTVQTEGKKMVEQTESPASPRTLEALVGLDDISLTLNDLKDESFTPTELMDENPHLGTQVDENFALMELDWEYSTLKEQTATNNVTAETEGKVVEKTESTAPPRTLEVLVELDDISLTLNDLIDESFIPTELMDGNPRQREWVNEYPAQKEPEAQDILPLEKYKQSMKKEKKKQEKEEKQERKKMEKMERKEMKKIEKENNEQEGTTGKWYCCCCYL